MVPVKAVIRPYPRKHRRGHPSPRYGTPLGSLTGRVYGPPRGYGAKPGLTLSLLIPRRINKYLFFLEIELFFKIFLEKVDYKI
jgi:hypothetical protein